MKAKLIKTPEQLYKLKFYNNEDMLACATALLSKQNCDELFGVVDVEELAREWHKQQNFNSLSDNIISVGYLNMFKDGFNKAMELNKDKVFTLEDVRKAFNKGYLMKFNPSDEYTETLTGLVQSLQQPTEIEVIIEMESIGRVKLGVGSKLEQMMPKLDSEGCLILKKI
jgi:hypothetical protein